MKVIILAAGRGSRLGQRTSDKPKCLCMLYGKTLLERCIGALEQAGINRADIGIVTGYLQEQIQVEGVTKFYNADWETTNMFVSLTMAEEWLKSEPCIVCYSDIVFSPRVIRELVLCDTPLVIPYYTDYWELWSVRMENPFEDLETFRIDNDGCLLEIGQKPKNREDIQGQFMGIIKFTPQSWAEALETIKRPMPKTIEKLDMTTLLNCMVQHGCSISAIKTDDIWLECDTSHDIEVYEHMICCGKIFLNDSID